MVNKPGIIPLEQTNQEVRKRVFRKSEQEMIVNGLSSDDMLKVVTSYPNIKGVSIIFSDLSDSNLLAIAQSCKQLETIYLGSCNEVTPEGVKQIVEGLTSSSLSKVVLDDCEKISEEDLKGVQTGISIEMMARQECVVS